MDAYGALLLIAVVTTGIFLIWLDGKRQRRKQLRLGLSDADVFRCWQDGISFEEMAEKRTREADSLRRFMAGLARLQRQAAGTRDRDDPDPRRKPDQPEDSGDSSDPLVLEGGGSDRGRSGG